MKMIILCIVFIYFIFQAYLDAKWMKVAVVPNRVMTAFLILMYGIDLIRYHCFSWTDIYIMIGSICILWLCHLFKWFSIGDFWGYVILLFSMRYLSPLYPKLDIFYFLIAMLIANGSCSIYSICFKRFGKIANRGKRIAFFPFLLFGYLSMIFLHHYI